MAGPLGTQMTQHIRNNMLSSRTAILFDKGQKTETPNCSQCGRHAHRGPEAYTENIELIEIYLICAEEAILFVTSEA